MNYIEIATIIILGWLAGAESGSWACVHPVIQKLNPEQQIVFQKGLLKTFGRVMPILMPLSFILTIFLCSGTPVANGNLFFPRLAVAILMGSMILTTVIFNVPVNVQTGTWTEGDYSDKWKKKRAVWRFFQGYRSIILVICFILLIVSK